MIRPPNVTLRWAVLVIIAADREGVHGHKNFTTTITCVPKHWSTINILNNNPYVLIVTVLHYGTDWTMDDVMFLKW